VFHEVGPDEQNARGPREAVNDLGTKNLLSSEERRCSRPDKVDRGTHALVRYSGARPCRHLYVYQQGKYGTTLHGVGIIEGLGTGCTLQFFAQLPPNSLYDSLRGSVLSRTIPHVIEMPGGR